MLKEFSRKDHIKIKMNSNFKELIKIQVKFKLFLETEVCAWSRPSNLRVKTLLAWCLSLVSLAGNCLLRSALTNRLDWKRAT